MAKDEINNFLSSSIHTIWFYKERSSCCISFLIALIQTIILRIYHNYGDGQSFISCPAPLQKLLTNNYNSLQLCALRIMILQIKSRARKQEC